MFLFDVLLHTWWTPVAGCLKEAIGEERLISRRGSMPARSVAHSVVAEECGWGGEDTLELEVEKWTTDFVSLSRSHGVGSVTRGNRKIARAH